MFWWFERQGQFLRYEARDVAADGYELCVVARQMMTHRGLDHVGPPRLRLPCDKRKDWH